MKLRSPKPLDYTDIFDDINQMKQCTFNEIKKLKLEHGGNYRAGKRKEARAISTKQAMHLIFKSDNALGDLALNTPKNRAIIVQYLKLLSKQFYLTIYKYAVVDSHIHLFIRTKSRETLQKFLKCFPGIVARKITKSEKGSKLA